MYKKLLLSVISLMTISAAFADVWYVVPNGTGDGTSWINASGDLQGIINGATSGDQVWVAMGTYQPAAGSSFSLVDGVSVFGGFNGTETDLGDRDYVANITILEGNKSGVVYNTNIGTSTVLDGFTITGGDCTASSLGGYYSGGGIYNQSSSPSIWNCIITGNKASNFGGGIYNDVSSSPFILNCKFYGNFAQQGGGMYNASSSSPTVTSCIFSGNWGTVSGGGMTNNASSNPILTNCLFSGDTATIGGGMANLNSSPTVDNCTFASNKASYGGGIWVDHANNNNTTLANCVIYNNNANGNGNSIYDGYTIPVFVAPHPSGIEPSGTNATPNSNVSYCLVQGGYTGTGNISLDPLFVNPVSPAAAPTISGNYSLQPVSPAINAGSNSAYNTAASNRNGSAATDFDLALNLRLSRSIIDMGAYEYPFPAINTNLSGAVYVDSVNGNDNNNGGSWQSAFQTLTQALAAVQASTGIDSVLVSRGTYFPAGMASATLGNPAISLALIRGNIKLYGGYPSGGGTRNITNNPTVLNGDSSSYHIMVIAGLNATDDSVVVDGFTFTKGYATGPGGDGYNNQTVYQYWGAGLDLTANANGGKLAIRNCVFKGNFANYSGAALHLNASSPTIYRCSFLGNATNSSNNGGGAGMHIDNGSSPIIIGCQFTGNASGTGSGAGIWNNGSSPTLVNCTIAGNLLTGGSGNGFGAGVANLSNSSPNIYNCIVYGNNANGNGDEIYDDGTGSPIVNYSMVQGGYVGTSNSSNNPNFVNPGNASAAPFANGDYRIQLGSMAIDAGNNNAYTTVGGSLSTDLDLANNPRLHNATIDMGAFENQGSFILPVVWLYFTGISQNGANILSWATTSETNNKGFYVEKSSNGQDFTTLFFVTAPSNTQAGEKYDYTDFQPFTGNNFYRLKQVDIDGQLTYSNVVELNTINKSWFSIYPNPATTILHATTTGLKGNLQIIDMLGHVVSEVNIVGDKTEIDISKLSVGTYNCKLGNENILFLKIK